MTWRQRGSVDPALFERGKKKKNKGHGHETDLFGCTRVQASLQEFNVDGLVSVYRVQARLQELQAPVQVLVAKQSPTSLVAPSSLHPH
jgi:hypothetical protein